MGVETFLTLVQTSPLLLVIYASLRGLIVWKVSHDQIMVELKNQIVALEKNLKTEEARTERAEQNATAMRNLVFETIGINKSVISKLDGQAGSPPIAQVT